MLMVSPFASKSFVSLLIQKGTLNLPSHNAKVRIYSLSSVPMGYS